MKRVKSLSKRMTAVILSALMVASMFTGCSFSDRRTSGKEEKPEQQEQNVAAENKEPDSENKAENTTPSTNNDGNQGGTQSGNNSGSQSSSQSGGNNSGSQSGSQSGGNNSGSQSGSQSGGNNSGSQSGSQSGGNNSGSQSGSQSGGNNSGSQNGSQSGGNNSGSTPSTPTPPSLEITQQADADYEEWLAAAMLIGVSMEYPDFKFDGLYTSSETSIESKANSDGVYIVFESKGKKMALHSSALDGERNTAGTKDLSTQALGFATFDSVDPSSVRTESMTKLDVADLEELINQSLLVSVHAR